MLLCDLLRQPIINANSTKAYVLAAQARYMDFDNGIHNRVDNKNAILTKPAHGWRQPLLKYD